MLSGASYDIRLVEIRREPMHIPSLRGVFRKRKTQFDWGSNVETIRLLFDEDFYLSQNPDVQAAGKDPIEHYVQHGWREGRRPNAIFDPTWYVSRYADVAALDRDPFHHFVEHGRFEGRLPSAAFDPSEYLRRNPDVGSSKMDPSEHYVRFGRAEGRSGAGSKVVSADIVQALIERSRSVSPDIDDKFIRFAANRVALELVRLDSEPSDWRDEVLVKRIYHVDDRRRPVPDGLSLAYLELADALNDQENAYDARMSDLDFGLVPVAEALIQRQVGEAVRLEHRLLSSVARLSDHDDTRP